MNTLRRICTTTFILVIISLSSIPSVKAERCEFENGAWECEVGDDNNDDDDNDLSPVALVGLIIGIIAILIALPVLFCFCCSCCCFKTRKEAPRTVFVVSPPTKTEDVDGSQTDIKIPMDDLHRNSGAYGDRQLPMYANVGPQQGPSAPHPMMASDEDEEGFYYLGFSNQPPPPYPFPIPLPEEEDPFYTSYGNGQSKSYPPYQAPEQITTTDKLEREELG